MNENLTTPLENEDDLLTGENQPGNDDTPPVDTGTESETEQPDVPTEDGETQPEPPTDSEEEGDTPPDSSTDLIKDPAADDKPSDDGEDSDTTTTGTGDSGDTTAGTDSGEDTGAADPGDEPVDGGSTPPSDPDSGEDPGADPNEGGEGAGDGSAADPDAGETDPTVDPDGGDESGSDQTGAEDSEGETAGEDQTGEGDQEGETGELIETPVDEPSPNLPANLVTGILVGVAVLLAAAVAVLSVLLALAKKKTRRTGKKTLGAGGTVRIGKLHAIGDRESQQDCFAVSPQEMVPSHGLLAVVADGMGGLEDGDKVSQTAVAAMLDGFFHASGTPQDVLLTLTEQANFRINSFLGPNKIGRCGSTMVAGLVRDGMFHYLSIGDSRICLYRDGQLIQLNREHVYRNDLTVQALSGVGSLQGAAQHPKAAGLTSFLGMGQLRYVDIPASGIEIRGGDKFILMSDGVYNALTAEEIGSALTGDAQQAADALGIMIAKKAYRHQDNYTAVILAC